LRALKKNAVLVSFFFRRSMFLQQSIFQPSQFNIMAKFMYLFRGGDGRMADLSPEQVQAHMGRWGAYMQRLSTEGHLGQGLPLKGEGKVVGGMGKVITDGPFAEGKEIVGGYLMVAAADLAEAVELSKACPIFEFDGSSVEVREIVEMEF
jgi:hypothetical protein